MVAEKKNVVFHLNGGYPHPNPRHLGSRIFTWGIITEYSNERIEILANEKKVSDLIPYVKDYLSSRSVRVVNVEVF